MPNDSNTYPMKPGANKVDPAYRDFATRDFDARQRTADLGYPSPNRLRPVPLPKCKLCGQVLQQMPGEPDEAFAWEMTNLVHVPCAQEHNRRALEGEKK